jgi:hypothetical protein
MSPAVIQIGMDASIFCHADVALYLAQIPSFVCSNNLAHKAMSCTTVDIPLIDVFSGRLRPLDIGIQSPEFSLFVQIVHQCQQAGVFSGLPRRMKQEVFFIRTSRRSRHGRISATDIPPQSSF